MDRERKRVVGIYAKYFSTIQEEMRGGTGGVVAAPRDTVSVDARKPVQRPLLQMSVFPGRNVSNYESFFYSCTLCIYTYMSIEM